MSRLIAVLVLAGMCFGCSRSTEPTGQTSATQPNPGGQPGAFPAPSAGADDAEDKAVKFVEGLKGKVTRDDTQPGKPVVKVELTGTEVTDAGVKELAALKNLTNLNLSFTKVTDAGVKELAALKNLTTLDLGETKVTDAGVKELQKALPKCKIVK